MRDQADTNTMGLPQVEPEYTPLPAPRRMSEQDRRELQAYEGPKVRDGCWSCQAFTWRVQSPDAMNERLVAYCKRGNFRCDKLGKCPAYAYNPRARRQQEAKAKPVQRMLGTDAEDDEAADRAAALQQRKDEEVAIARRAAQLRGGTVEPPLPTVKACTHAWYRQSKVIEQGIEHQNVVCVHCGDSHREPW